MVDILKELQNYVPIANGEKVPVILWGDGLSCERVVDAQESVVNTATQDNTLLEFEPSPQEWHKRLQYVTVNKTRFFFIKLGFRGIYHENYNCTAIPTK